MFANQNTSILVVQMKYICKEKIFLWMCSENTCLSSIHYLISVTLSFFEHLLGIFEHTQSQMSKVVMDHTGSFGLTSLLKQDHPGAQFQGLWGKHHDISRKYRSHTQKEVLPHIQVELAVHYLLPYVSCPAVWHNISLKIIQVFWFWLF